MAGSPPRAGAAWCLQFVERRCGAFASAALANEGTRGGTESLAGAPVLSLAEVDPVTPAQDAAEHEHLAVLVLKIRGAPGAPIERIALRLITPSAMRSASRTHGARWLVSDIVVPTPAGLEEVSLLVYRVRRTPRLERVLAAVENVVETLEAADDDDDLNLGRAALERLEVLDKTEEAEVVLSGCRLRFGAPNTPDDERFVAVVASGPGAPGPDNLWLIERKLHEGPDRAFVRPVDGRPYALLRLGPRSTRQSVREFIEEIRRRHQRRPGKLTSDEGESFESFVRRQVDKRRQELIKATFGHHKMLPMVTPVALEAATNLSTILKLSDDPPSPFKQLIEAMRAEFQGSFGVRIPDIRIQINEAALPSGTYIIMFDEIPLVSGNLDLNKLLCLADPDALARAPLLGERAHLDKSIVPDGSGRAACWILAERGEEVRKAGFETWDAASYIQAHLRSVIAANLAMFANLDEVGHLLSDRSEQLLQRVRGARGGLSRFVEIARSLLMEKLPIQPIEPLAQRYLEFADGPTLELAEELRRLPAIHAYLTRGVADWRLFVLAESEEVRIRDNVHREGDAALFCLEPEPTQELLTAVRNALGSSMGQRQVLVVSDWRLRPFVRSLLVLEFPQVQIVARRELEGVPGVPAPAATIMVER